MYSFDEVKKADPQVADAITAEMERLRAQQDAIVFDRNPTAEAEWDRLGDQIRALNHRSL